MKVNNLANGIVIVDIARPTTCINENDPNTFSSVQITPLPGFKVIADYAGSIMMIRLEPVAQGEDDDG